MHSLVVYLHTYVHMQVMFLQEIKNVVLYDMYMHASQYYSIQKIRRYQKLELRYDYTAVMLLNITHRYIHSIHKCAL